MSPFFALLYKDWRLGRVALFGGLILIGVFYLVGVIMMILDIYEQRSFGSSFVQTFQAMGLIGVVIAALMGVVYGGIAFAGERRERSAEFLAMLPVSREEILFSKLLSSMAGVMLLFLVNFCVLGATIARSSRGMTDDLGDPIGAMLAATVLLFGVAWLLSTFFQSPAIAASASIAVSVALFALLQALFRTRLSSSELYYLSVTAAVMVGLFCFLGGSRYYLRRIEP